MKTRLQLIRGYINGTLTADEKKAAETNPVVMNAIETMKKAEIKEEKQQDKKGVKHARS